MRAGDAGSWLLLGVPDRRALTARAAARPHAARTVKHASTQHYQRAPSIIRELEVAQQFSNAAPNGTAPAVQPCRR
eukprot:4873811-Prymnesium_polylepis.1